MVLVLLCEAAMGFSWCSCLRQQRSSNCHKQLQDALGLKSHVCPVCEPEPAPGACLG